MAKKANVTIKRLETSIQVADNTTRTIFGATFEIIERQSFNGTEYGCILDGDTPKHCEGFELKFSSTQNELFEFLSNHVNGKFEIEYDENDNKLPELKKVVLLNG